MSDTTTARPRILTDNMVHAVLEACEGVGATAYRNDDDRLEVVFPGSEPLVGFAQFVIYLEGCSFYWELGEKFAACAKNICHDSHGLEVEFTAISGVGFPSPE